MDVSTTSNPASFADRVRKQYNPKLLEGVELAGRLTKYARTETIAPGSGWNGVRFFRRRIPTRAGVLALTEGTVPTTYTDVNTGYIDVLLKQRGAISKITDVVTATDLLKTVDLHSKALGEDAALDFDAICWRSMVSKPAGADADGTANPIASTQKTLNGSNTAFERFCGVVNTGNSSQDYDTFRAQAVASASITRAAHIGAITQLRNRGVPSISGKYPVICPSAVLGDIRQTPLWVSAAAYNPDKMMFPWGEMELDGAVFVEQTMPHKYWLEDANVAAATGMGIHSEASASTPSAASAGPIYSLLYLGRGAFGTPRMTGKIGSDPATPSLQMVTGADSGNPLAQFLFLGWKAFYQSALLWTNEATDVPFVVQLRCRSPFI